MGSEGSESTNENFHNWEWNVHRGLEVAKRLSEIILHFFAEKDGSSHLGKDGSQLCSGWLHQFTLDPLASRTGSSGGMCVGDRGWEKKGKTVPKARFQL